MRKLLHKLYVLFTVVWFKMRHPKYKVPRIRAFHIGSCEGFVGFLLIGGQQSVLEEAGKPVTVGHGKDFGTIAAAIDAVAGTDKSIVLR